MNVRLNVNGGELFAVSLKGLSLRPNDKFLKVPGDVRPADGTPNQELGVVHEGARVIIGIGELIFEICKDWVCACAVDVALLKDGKAGLKATAWTHMLQGIQDLTIAAVLLISKLVTGKPQHHEAMGVLALKLVELAEVPGGGASERGHILDQDYPSPKHVEIHRVSLQRGGSQVVEGLGDERHLDSCAFLTGSRRDLNL